MTMRFIMANSVGSKSSRRFYPNSIFEAAQVNAFLFRSEDVKRYSVNSNFRVFLADKKELE